MIGGRGARTMIQLLVATACVLTIANARPLTRGTNPLLSRNGVLVQKVGESRVINKVWSCILHIDSPKVIDLSQWFTNVTDLIKLKGAQYFGASQTQYWFTRIDGIRDDIAREKEALGDSTFSIPNSTTTSFSRKKRAIFSFVGTLSHFLFGTATSEEVTQLKLEIRKAERSITNSVQDIYHNEKALMSVFKGSIDLVKQNDMKIGKMSSIIKNLISDVNTETSAINNLTRRVDTLNVTRFD